jgi:uncharacterized membrane protein YfcA
MEFKKPKKRPNKYVQFSGIAFQMAATIFIGTYIGVKLDKKFPNEKNLFTLIFSLLFVFISLYSVIKQVSKISKNKNE